MREEDNTEDAGNDPLENFSDAGHSRTGTPIEETGGGPVPETKPFAEPDRLALTCLHDMSKRYWRVVRTQP
jgi:hypothetical protein